MSAYSLETSLSLVPFILSTQNYLVLPEDPKIQYLKLMGRKLQSLPCSLSRSLASWSEHFGQLRSLKTLLNVQHGNPRLCLEGIGPWPRPERLGAKIHPYSGLGDQMSRSSQETLEKWHHPKNQKYSNKAVESTGSCSAHHSLGPDPPCLLPPQSLSSQPLLLGKETPPRSLVI